MYVAMHRGNIFIDYSSNCIVKLLINLLTSKKLIDDGLGKLHEVLCVEGHYVGTGLIL